ncbi:MAG: response regulator [Sandaracinus sp.]
MSLDDRLSPRGWKILVVDDEPAELDRFHQIIRALGGECIGLGSAFGATNAAVEQRVQVVVLDETMAGLSGGGLWASMRERVVPRPGVVFASDGSGDPGALKRRFPEAQVLTKPVTPETMLTALVQARRLAGD